jgi:hypothetical protein
MAEAVILASEGLRFSAVLIGKDIAQLLRVVKRKKSASRIFFATVEACARPAVAFCSWRYAPATVAFV